jgi:hypothetical protein
MVYGFPHVVTEGSTREPGRDELELLFQDSRWARDDDLGRT